MIVDTRCEGRSMGKKQSPKFYVVWKGRQSGVYTTWADCEQQVKGFQGAKFKSFPTRGQAERAFSEPYQRHIAMAGSGPSKSVPLLTLEELEALGVIRDSICVDAACSGNPGVLEYRGVVTASGELFFDAGPFDDGTVNMGEFLAIVQALALLKLEQRGCCIYSDSVTALAWVRDKRPKTTMPRTKANEPLFQMLEWAEAWLRDNEYPNKIIKWDTEHWGEIPADYGRK
jgi:ribonuclease HI